MHTHPVTGITENCHSPIGYFEGTILPRVMAMAHYHIQWENSKLDWEAFQTKRQATDAAEQLKRQGENYTIVERDGDCPRCTDLKKVSLDREESDNHHHHSKDC